MLHSKVLSWLPPSAAAELLVPGVGLSVPAVEPEAGGGAAVAIYKQSSRLESTEPSWSEYTHTEVRTPMSTVFYEGKEVEKQTVRRGPFLKSDKITPEHEQPLADSSSC